MPSAFVIEKNFLKNKAMLIYDEAVKTILDNIKRLSAGEMPRLACAGHGVAKDIYSDYDLLNRPSLPAAVSPRETMIWSDLYWEKSESFSFPESRWYRGQRLRLV